MDVYSPHLTRLEYNWIGREIEFLVPNEAGLVCFFVDLCPELFLHRDFPIEIVIVVGHPISSERGGGHDV